MGLIVGIFFLLAARPLRDAGGAQRRRWGITVLGAAVLGFVLSNGTGGGLAAGAAVVTLMDALSRD